MPNVDSHLPNTFCWAELTTTDPTAAKAFYGELFGWSLRDNPMPEGVYIMASLKDRNVGAMYQMPEEQRKQGVPSHWLNYVSVTDADQTVQKIERNGGKLMMKPFEVMDYGRMTVAMDPQGAMFALWQPRSHAGAQIVNEPGAMCWTELSTRDVESARRFYKAVFGWDMKTDNSGMPYTELSVSGKPFGGMLAIQKEWGDVPPHWMPYFAVADCNASADRAKKLKGKVHVPPRDIPNVGRFAVLEDPTGASFAIISFPT
jgi:predicted enzyme related to lactoylglutathione lyase